MAVQSQKVVSRIEPAGWLLVILGGVLPLILGCVLNDGVLLVFAGVVLLVMVLARVLGRWNLTQLAVEVEMPSLRKSKVLAG